jgi:hypothetical protein
MADIERPVDKGNTGGDAVACSCYSSTILAHPNKHLGTRVSLSFFAHVLAASIVLRALRGCVAGIRWPRHQGPRLGGATDEAHWALFHLGN